MMTVATQNIGKMAATWGRCTLRATFLLVVIVLSCGVNGKSHLVLLNEDNWDQMLQDEWMIEFYAPWCPACRALQPIWNEFASWGEELGVKVGQVDVTTSPGLSGRFMVTALPTVFHVLNGEFRQYRGSRDKEAFMAFVEKRKWEDVEPIPSWKSPASFQMSAVAWFFKLSQMLRAVHTQLMDDYGLPTWGSYLIFALATIFLGTLLGLLMVCVIDRIYPPRLSDARGHVYSKKAREMDLRGKDEGDEDYDPVKDDLVDEEGSQESSQEGGCSKTQSSADEDDDGEKNSPPSTPGTPGKARQRKSRKAD